MSTPNSYSDEHEAFAASRVIDYVFEPTRDIYFNTLDQHADTLDGDIKPPLVLLGDEGSGKSALLANWVSKRREHKHREEFLFQHYVGCSSQSSGLLDTLYRLETALKTFFQLREMKVPETEVELRWSLNRFLEAASKKTFPARIVIVIDGVNRLKGDGSAEGALHWLPTDLPPCVRFIVSTVENDRTLYSRTKKEATPHRTFVELVRRQCPLLSVEPLSSTTRSRVVKSFMQMYEGDISLTEEQCFKIVASEASAQPMYLRTLLQGLTLAIELTDSSPDQVLEDFLRCTTASDLLDRYLNICCRSSFGDDDESVTDRSTSQRSVNTASSVETSDIMGKMLSIVYVSRSGLSVDEIWGLIKMVSKVEPSENQAAKLLSILNGFTMVVDGLQSLSHEIYREVIYTKYICSRESLIKWHNVLARFFGQLPPCGRKLSALPYHLETAGSWSKVKNCLTDIEMFQLWWTPKYKSDFIQFWASLTRVTAQEDDVDTSSKTKNNTDTGKKKKNKEKPIYDMVEEYTKSLDEYRIAKHPSDEVVSGLILTIGDFLLEFATLGHESNADVPALIHPKVLNEDLKAIGVPYIEIDEEGRSSLEYPDILSTYTNRNSGTEDGPGQEGGKAIDDMPECTSYFFSRWMWIHFPYIALGNCDKRYTFGVKKKITDMADHVRGGGKKGNLDEGSMSTTKKERSAVITATRQMSKSMSAADLKLPAIKFNRKAAKSIPRVNKSDEDEVGKANTKVQQRMDGLQDNIANYREEYDFVVQMKSIVSKRLLSLKDTLSDLKRTADSTSQFTGALDEISVREQTATTKYESVITLNSNLVHLAGMSDRHPACVQALIENLQMKIEQDGYLIEEIKKRLWEQRFERQMHSVNFRQCKKLVGDAVNMHNSLLEYKYENKKSLSVQATADERAIQEKNRASSALAGMKSKSSDLNDGSLDPNLQQNASDPASEQEVNLPGSWEEVWQIISSRTGIMEPPNFFERIKNRQVLLEQINTIKKSSEARLEFMKKEAVTNEAELEEVRYKASFAGMQSSKEQVKALVENQGRLKRIKEKAEAAEQLEQTVVAGLAHISDLVFVQRGEEDAPVMNMVRDIEAALDTLINEREKQLQQSQTQGKDPRDTSQVMPDMLNRSPELDFAIAKHENPKVRLPSKLPSRTKDESDMKGFIQPQEEEEEEEQELGTWDRTFVKTLSSRNVKTELKKMAKLTKGAIEQ